MTQSAKQKLNDGLNTVREHFIGLLDERLDEMEVLRNKIDLRDHMMDALKNIQFITHKIAGTAGTLGFLELGLLAAEVENKIIDYANHETHTVSLDSTLSEIDTFIEFAAELSSQLYWENHQVT